MEGALENIVIVKQDVTDVISCIEPLKAGGQDLVSPRLLLEGADILEAHLSTFFTTVFLCPSGNLESGKLFLRKENFPISGLILF